MKNYLHIVTTKLVSSTGGRIVNLHHPPSAEGEKIGGKVNDTPDSKEKFCRAQLVSARESHAHMTQKPGIIGGENWVTGKTLDCVASVVQRVLL